MGQMIKFPDKTEIYIKPSSIFSTNSTQILDKHYFNLKLMCWCLVCNFVFEPI